MRVRSRSSAVIASAVGLSLSAAGVVVAASPASAHGRPTAAHGPRRAPHLDAIRHEQALASGPKPTSKPTPPPSKPTAAPAGNHAIPFAPDAAWFLRADTATALAPDSADQVANLVRQVRDSNHARAHINWDHYNTSIVTAAPGTRRVQLGFTDCQGTGPFQVLYAGRGVFENVPVPDSAVPAPGGDGQMTIYDPSTDQLWELWQMQKRGDGWAACWGGRIDKVSTSRGHFQGTEGASASGVALAGGAITIADVRRGYINHALNLNVREPAGWQFFTWPAQRSDGPSTTLRPGALREGQRLRLDPAVDVKTLGLNRLGTMIARAAQEYGFIVTDTSPDVSVVTEDGSMEQARTGTNPWPELLGGAEWDILPSFPWDRMQALPLAYGK